MGEPSTREQAHAVLHKLRGIAPATVFLLMLCGVVALLARREVIGMSPQSGANLRFARNESLVDALRHYPTAWPPLYPAAEWLWAKLGGPVRAFNAATFYGVVLCVYFYARRFDRKLAWAPAILVATLHASYVIMYQQVSETLFALTALVALVVGSRYLDRPSTKLAIALGATVGSAALVRYYALFWLVPWSAWLIWSSSALPRRRRFFNVLACATSVLVLTLPWLIYIKTKTGYFSGMNRSQARALPRSIGYWNEATDLTHNVLYVARSVVLDLFSPWRHGTHPNVHGASAGTSVMELVIASAWVVLLVYGAVVTFAGRREQSVQRGIAEAAPVIALAGMYYLVLIVLWTYGNNDPIYTRFLAPSYPLVVLCWFHVLRLSARRDRAAVLASAAAGVLLLVVNVARFFSDKDWRYVLG